MGGREHLGLNTQMALHTVTLKGQANLTWVGPVFFTQLHLPEITFFAINI